jgi:hypothetical protein
MHLVGLHSRTKGGVDTLVSLESTQAGELG